MHIGINDEEREEIDYCLGNWQSYCNERIKCDWLLLAIRTCNFRFVLTSHQIHNNRLISLDVGHPTFKGDHLVRSSIAFYWRNVRLCLDTIEILMKTVNQKGKELLRVVLSISREHWIDRADCIFYVVRGVSRARVAPHWLYELGIASGQFAICADWVHFIYFVHEVASKEVLSQWHSVGHAL